RTPIAPYNKPQDAGAIIHEKRGAVKAVSTIMRQIKDHFKLGDNNSHVTSDNPVCAEAVDL
ncbi:hypothetical protein ACQWF7_24620, partial [Salmonella enterica subsp. enterica serovar Infantis]